MNLVTGYKDIHKSVGRDEPRPWRTRARSTRSASPRSLRSPRARECREVGAPRPLPGPQTDNISQMDEPERDEPKNGKR